MNIVIFGANGPTGQILTKQALAAEHTVVAVTRHPEAFPLQNVHLHVMRGDVFDLASVEQAVAGPMRFSLSLVSPIVANPSLSIHKARPIFSKPSTIMAYIASSV